MDKDGNMLDYKVDNEENSFKSSTANWN